MALWSDRSITVRPALIFLLMGAALAFRAYFAVQVMPPPLRMQGEATQAYRYSLLVSQGEGIPGLDTLAMHPEGFVTSQNSIFEEYVAGGLHRIIGGDFDRFMRLFCLAFPLLSMPGIFLWMRAAGFTDRQSFLAAALYGIILPALLRTRGESLYRETVALPLLVFLGWTLERAMGEGPHRTRWACASGMLLFACLAAWKVTAFLSFFIFIYLLFSKRVPRSAGLLLPVAAAQIAASLLLAHMRHDMALASPATVLAVALAASCIPAAPLRRFMPWLGSAAAAASALLLPGAGGHVSSVILAKLRFLFQHPADPLLLSPDARLFWVGGYTSPTPGEFLWLFGPLALAAVPGMVPFQRTARGRLIAFFLPAALAGFLFFDRLHVFLAVALVPVLAVSARKRIIVPLLFVLAGAHSLLAPTFAEKLSQAGLSFRPGASLLTDSELDGYLDWVERSTEPGSAILAYWNVSGLTSAYGQRPTVLHTFFENEGNRRRIVAFAGKLFESEAGLVQFMEENDASYLVYQADFMLDDSWQGVAYLGGIRDPGQTSAAYLMQYRPESLERLAPVWQGASMRVFELDGTASSLPRNPLFEERYRRFFDYGTAGAALSDPVGTALSLGTSGLRSGNPDAVSAGLLLLSRHSSEVPADASIGLLQFLVEAHLSGAYGILELEQDFEAYLDGWGPDRELSLDLVRLLEQAGMRDRAMHQYERAFSAGGSQ